MPHAKTSPPMIYPLGQGRAEFRALATDAPELLIYGDIGDTWWDEESVSAKQIVETLEAVTADLLTVRINSYGGIVADGIAIHNALRRHRAAVQVEIDGVAYSIASLIAMAGDQIIMADNSLLMIHAPWGLTMGNASELRRTADTLDKYAEAMASSYVRAAGMTYEQALALLKDGEDHYYTAAEAKAAGLIDDISASERPIAAAVRTFDLRHFKHPEPTMPDKQPKSDPKSAATAQPQPHQQQTPAQASTAPPSADNVVQIEQAAAAAERKRIAARNAELRPIFARFFDREPGVRELYDEVITDPSVTSEQARERLLAKLGEGSEPAAGVPNIQSGIDARDKARDGMRDGLLMRMGAVKHDASNEFRGLRLSEMARACLRGINYPGADRLSAEELAPLALSWAPVRGMQTTSDFPVLLEEAMHKLILRGFQGVPTTYDRFCKIGDVSDFRSWNRLIPGLIGNLDGVNEAGEYKDKILPDAEKNAIAATRKGNIISLTPETLVNDDTGYIADMANSLGAAGPRTIERAVYALLESNPTLSDGYALFSAEHANWADSGASPTMTLIDTAASAMAAQTAPGDDAEYLDIIPSVILCHRGLRGLMVSIIDSPYDPDVANKLQKPNIVRGMADVVSSPRLSAKPWYLFADPMVAPVIEVVFLNGQREPRIIQEESFRTGGLSWRIEMPFGVGAIDYRGVYKNDGE